MRTPHLQRAKPRREAQVVRIRLPRSRSLNDSGMSESIREFHCGPPERPLERLEIMSEAEKEIYERTSER